MKYGSWLPVLLVFILMGCEPIYPKRYHALQEVEGLIIRYYDNISTVHPLDFGRSVHELDTKNSGSASITIVGNYLIQHGYHVRRLDRPQLIRTEGDYLLYRVTIEIKYPDDLSVKSKKQQMTEQVWFHYDHRKIVKISSDDPFLSARTIQEEYPM